MIIRIQYLHRAPLQVLVNIQCDKNFLSHGGSQIISFDPWEIQAKNASRSKRDAWSTQIIYK